MRVSSIVVPKVEKAELSPQTSKIVEAYRKERRCQELTEVELNRRKIIMIDEYGNIKKPSILFEH
ncbi:hypothetical protein ACN3E9_02255 [Vibrio pectenicida]|uniref:Uncharacterized protein n=1 Tax=Vibrio pectenicida TaxID=62763 RepID=A0A427TZ43_9VIBR|nr:hypothetical protein [Vibrio pectenicida]RSD29703.1 hypothetical protein EJA03_17695 [Vibrio pectenicida]